jgi:toxin ParE1/3/4
VKAVWTPEALEDRRQIWDYIAANNPRAAAKMDALFSAAAARLANHPKLGRPGKIAGTRELIPHENYRLACLAYEIEGETVWILVLVHTARQWPPIRSE